MKRIPLGGMPNVRDLGGYPCPGGFTKHLMFLRAGMPRKLTDKDLEFLLAHDITTIIDLRNLYEIEYMADPFSELDSFYYHNCPMFADGVLPMSADEMAPAYLRLATTPTIIGPVWKAIADAPGGVLFHCTAGKDRTAVVAALLLWMAGVEKPDILADYIATQAYVLEPYRRMLRSNPDFPYFLTRAELSYIEDFYEAFIMLYKEPADYLLAMGLDANQTETLLDKLRNA